MTRYFWKSWLEDAGVSVGKLEPAGQHARTQPGCESRWLVNRLGTQFKMTCTGRFLLQCFTLLVVLTCLPFSFLSLSLSKSLVCSTPAVALQFLKERLRFAVIMNTSGVLEHCLNPQKFILNYRQDPKRSQTAQGVPSYG